MEEKELFKHICLTGLSIAHAAGQRLISPQRAIDIRFKWLVGTLCRGCKRPVTSLDFDIWITYWSQCWAPCHVSCRAAGMKEEAIECQTIDADCNDCIHFKRAEIIGGIPKAVRGHCLKLDRPTVAYPHFWTGRPCFEHRRAITSASLACSVQ